MVVVGSSCLRPEILLLFLRNFVNFVVGDVGAMNIGNSLSEYN